MLRYLFSIFAMSILVLPAHANHQTITTTEAAKTTSFPVTQSTFSGLSALPFILNDDGILNLEAQFAPFQNRLVLFLAKGAPSAEPASVGAFVINPHRPAASLNVTPTQMGFDYYAVRSWTGSADPRFNFNTTDGVFHATVGPLFGTRTSSPNGNGWFRISFDPTDSSQTFPVATAGEVLQDLTLVLFTGNNGDGTGSPNPGRDIIDNIMLNNQLVGKIPHTVFVQ